MYIRLLEKSERKYIKELYMEAFDDNEMYVDYYIGEYSEHADTMACIKDSKIVSMANIHHKQVMFGGNLCEAAYIYGVATKEEYKNHGYMKKVLNETVRMLERRGINLIYIIPSISPTIYESVGFKLIRNEKIFNIYDDDMWTNPINVEKNYRSLDELKKHMSYIIKESDCGYIEYKVHPVMVLNNEFAYDVLSSKDNESKSLGIMGEKVNIDIKDIKALEDIYGIFLENNDV